MSLRARAMADRVHQRLGFERPPVNAGLLLAHASIDVVTMDWPVDLAGVLLLGSQKAVIGLNQRHSPAKRHFSFWHEVGHYVLHRREVHSGLSCSGSSAGVREREADEFAVNVLMPRCWVAESVVHCHGAAAMARRFMVSRQAMERRLRELGLDLSRRPPSGEAVIVAHGACRYTGRTLPSTPFPPESPL